jgi:hypothetical protein
MHITEGALREFWGLWGFGLLFRGGAKADVFTTKVTKKAQSPQRGEAPLLQIIKCEGYGRKERPEDRYTL